MSTTQKEPTDTCRRKWLWLVQKTELVHWSGEIKWWFSDMSNSFLYIHCFGFVSVMHGLNSFWLLGASTLNSPVDWSRGAHSFCDVLRRVIVIWVSQRTFTDFSGLCIWFLASSDKLLIFPAIPFFFLTQILAFGGGLVSMGVVTISNCCMIHSRSWCSQNLCLSLTNDNAMCSWSAASTKWWGFIEDV